LLAEGIDVTLARLVADKCLEIGCRAVAVGNAADHVHALVVLAPTMSVASLAHRVKGATSRILGQRLSEPFAWQAGYFAESVGDIAGVASYVRAQRERHRASGSPEGWEPLERLSHK